MAKLKTQTSTPFVLRSVCFIFFFLGKKDVFDDLCPDLLGPMCFIDAAMPFVFFPQCSETTFGMLGAIHVSL